MSTVSYRSRAACLRLATALVVLRWAAVCGVVTLGGMHDLRGDERPSGRVPSSPLIRPWNFDPMDQTAYLRRQGRPDPGGRVSGSVWNAGGVSPTAAMSRAATAEERASDRDVVTEVAGYSVRGVPIVIHYFGDVRQAAGPRSPAAADQANVSQPSDEVERVLIFGGIHGNEENSAELARRLVTHLRENPEVWRGRRLALLPVANPDGIAKGSRTNSRGVDLNRNFPATNWAPGEKGLNFGGDKPAGEPETRVLVELVETFAPDRIVSIHAISRGRECNNYDGPGERLAREMAKSNGYPVKKSIGYPTPGSFGTWAGVERQVPTITLELPQGMPGDECWVRQQGALEAAIRGAR